MLTLAEVAENPHRFSHTLITSAGEPLIVRPLMASDVAELAQFLANLSPETRRLSTFDGYDAETAQALCDAIARYDKLRFVVQVQPDQIVGLLEFSFAILQSDIDRYQLYGIALDPATDCRFGPTLADDYQNRRVGTLVMPILKGVARLFGCKRMILWGGVLRDNQRAIRFYEKNGFQRAGSFKNTDNIELVDMLLVL